LNILVRNLPKGVTENDLMQLFQKFGTIASLNIVTDKATGKSKGFGFVEMPENSEAATAIKALDGRLVRSLKIRVKAATQSKTPLPAKPAATRPERGETRAKQNVIKGKKRGSKTY
jgi:RNA recognition motif-containing protein